MKNSFEGALEIDNITPPKGRSFLFRVTFHVTHPRLKAIAATGKKPPLHFHPYQAEFFKVISGKVTIEVEGAERVLSAESGEVSIEPGPYHRLWPTPGSEENLIFDLSASEAPDVSLIVDQCFFENWYGYQNDVLLHGEKLDIIQVMNVRIPLRSLNSLFWVYFWDFCFALSYSFFIYFIPSLCLFGPFLFASLGLLGRAIAPPPGWRCSYLYYPCILAMGKRYFEEG